MTFDFLDIEYFFQHTNAVHIFECIYCFCQFLKALEQYNNLPMFNVCRPLNILAVIKQTAIRSNNKY